MSFAKHYQTGESLPQSEFQKIKDLKNFGSGLAMLRQLYFSELDMRLHHEYDPYSLTQSPFQLQSEIADSFTILKPLEEDRFLCSFMHIFGGGYAAGFMVDLHQNSSFCFFCVLLGIIHTNMLKFFPLIVLELLRRRVGWRMKITSNSSVNCSRIQF